MSEGGRDGVGLALGGGGARGLAHVHVLAAFDDLGVRPAAIAGSSIGALMGAAYGFGMTADAIGDHVLQSFAAPHVVMGRLWASRPTRLADFRADGGLRFGQLNAERLLAAFMPQMAAADFSDLGIPLTVVATDFYARREVSLRSGPLLKALAASIALPAVFRPVRHEGAVLIDGGITNPLPFDRLGDGCRFTVAVDVNGGPDGDPARMPAPMEAVVGASQLMQQAIVETKLRVSPPDLLFRPPVSRWRVLDFLQAKTILAETDPLREEAKWWIAALLEGATRPVPAPLSEPDAA